MAHTTSYPYSPAPGAALVTVIVFGVTVDVFMGFNDVDEVVGIVAEFIVGNVVLVPVAVV